jgi:hypothetical protein
MQQEHAEWTCSMNMRHGYAARTTCGMEHGFRKTKWTKDKSSYKKIYYPMKKGGRE